MTVSLRVVVPDSACMLHLGCDSSLMGTGGHVFYQNLRVLGKQKGEGTQETELVTESPTVQLQLCHSPECVTCLSLQASAFLKASLGVPNCQ